MVPSFPSLSIFDNRPTLSPSQFEGTTHASASSSILPGDRNWALDCDIWGFLEEICNGRTRKHPLTRAKTQFYFGRTPGPADIPLPSYMRHLHNEHCVLYCEERKGDNGLISNRFSIQTYLPDCTFVREPSYMLVLVLTP